MAHMSKKTSDEKIHLEQASSVNCADATEDSSGACLVSSSRTEDTDRTDSGNKFVDIVRITNTTAHCLEKRNSQMFGKTKVELNSPGTTSLDKDDIDFLESLKKLNNCENWEDNGNFTSQDDCSVFTENEVAVDDIDLRVNGTTGNTTKENEVNHITKSKNDTKNVQLNSDDTYFDCSDASPCCFENNTEFDNENSSKENAMFSNEIVEAERSVNQRDVVNQILPPHNITSCRQVSENISMNVSVGAGALGNEERLSNSAEVTKKINSTAMIHCGPNKSDIHFDAVLPITASHSDSQILPLGNSLVHIGERNESIDKKLHSHLSSFTENCSFKGNGSEYVQCFNLPLPLSTQSQLNVGITQNSTTSNSFTDCKFQNSGDKTKVCFSFPLKSEPNVSFNISNMFSNMPASKNSASVTLPAQSSTGQSDVIDPKGDLLNCTPQLSPSNFKFKFPSFKFSPVLKPLDKNLNEKATSPTLESSFRRGNFFKCDSATSEPTVETSSLTKTPESVTSEVKFEFSNPKEGNFQTTSGSTGLFGNVSLTATSTALTSPFKGCKFTLPIFSKPVSTYTSNPSLCTSSPWQDVLTPRAPLFGQLPQIASTATITTPSTKTSSGINPSTPTPNFNFGSNSCFGNAGTSSGFFTAKPTFAPKNLFPQTNIFDYKPRTEDQQVVTNPSNNEMSTFSTVPSNFNSSVFAFGSSERQQTCGSSSVSDSNVFSSGKSCNDSAFVSSSRTNTALFNFKGSKAQNYIRPPRIRSSVNSIPDKTQVPFKMVLGTDTYISNGVTRTITTRLHFITAMPEYSSFSFEELRLQYDKYNPNRGTVYGIKTVNKKTQTSENLLEPGGHLVDMWKILECPVCLEIVTSPVLQCQRGHHVCNHCWKRVTACPLCKHYKSTTRNYAAEALVEKLPLPCKYRVDGCMKIMGLALKKSHEDRCSYRTYICLVDACNQAFSYKEMISHMKTSHCHLISGNHFCIPKGEKYSLTVNKHSFDSLVHAFDIPGWGIFFLRYKVSGQNTFLWLQVIVSDASKSQDFQYIVELADRQELRSVSYKGPVLPMHTVIGEQQDCLIVADLLLNTLKKNFGFHIKVIIWKTESHE